MYEEAYQESFKLQTLGGVSPPMVEMQEIHAKSGWKGTYEKSLAMMVHERSAGKYVSAYDIAETYLALGEDEQTLDWLQKAADEHANQVIYLKVDPRYDRLRSNPRFQDLLRNLHLCAHPSGICPAKSNDPLCQKTLRIRTSYARKPSEGIVSFLFADHTYLDDR
jgi:hypothetical protein